MKRITEKLSLIYILSIFLICISGCNSFLEPNKGSLIIRLPEKSARYAASDVHHVKVTLVKEGEEAERSQNGYGTVIFSGLSTGDYIISGVAYKSVFEDEDNIIGDGEVSVFITEGESKEIELKISLYETPLDDSVITSYSELKENVEAVSAGEFKQFIVKTNTDWFANETINVFGRVNIKWESSCGIMRKTDISVFNVNENASLGLSCENGSSVSIDGGSFESGNPLVIVKNADFVVTGNISFENATLSNSTEFKGRGAAINCSNNGSGEKMLSLTNCSFRDNTSDGNGGAIYSGGVAVTLEGVSFENNTSHGTNGGGAIYFSGSSTYTSCVLLADVGCSFIENHADSSEANSGNGGAIYINAGIGQIIEGVTFDGNTISNGNGKNVYCGNAVLKLGSKEITESGDYLDTGFYKF